MSDSTSAGRGIDAVVEFLGVPTPAAWVERAVADLPTLLLDHATLELKAARQALNLIARYGAAPPGAAAGRPPDAAFRSRLVQRMSRLAREELRHFEQVVALIERRGGQYRALPASRYAGGLHALARREEPGALVDALVIGAVIEARSCERFACLVGPLADVDAGLADFYAALLRSESRHFADYLALARAVSDEDTAQRVAVFLERDAELVTSVDDALRFHSGPPVAETSRASSSRATPAVRARSR